MTKTRTTQQQIQTRRDDLMSLPARILLIQVPGRNHLVGPVEHSFSIGLSGSRTRLLLSGTFYDNIFGNEHLLDCDRDARRWRDDHLKHNPGHQVQILHARDSDALPVILDWESWLYDAGCNERQTRSNFGFRNIRFTPRDTI